MKVKPTFNPTGRLIGYSFNCPGCGHDHTFYTDPEAMGVAWYFNGAVDNPTFIPSLLNTTDHGTGTPEITRCHLFVTAGKIIYCGDCTHDLKRQTIDMPDYE